MPDRLGGQKTALSGSKNRIRIYAGQYFDSDTGLHYNYHRYYDPKLGRYLRADPIGLAGGINPYVYAVGNPVNMIDPLGLEVFEVNDLYDTGFHNRSPDYYSFSASLFNWGMTFEVDRYGNFYATILGHPSLDIPYPPRIGDWKLPKMKIWDFNLSAGWIDECGIRPPKENQLNEFLSEWSKDFSMGYWLGGGYTWAGGMRAFEIGIMAPQLALDLPYSSQIHF